MTTSTRQILLEKAAGIALADFVPSPCVSVCRMDPVSELCEGCFRSLDEIALWGRMDERGKREVWQQIGQRMARRQVPGERKLA